MNISKREKIEEDQVALRHISHFHARRADDASDALPPLLRDTWQQFRPYFLLPKANMQDQPLPGHSQG